jgi:hypothetical protein
VHEAEIRAPIPIDTDSQPGWPDAAESQSMLGGSDVGAPAASAQR